MAVGKIIAKDPWAEYAKATAERSIRSIWMGSGEVGTGKTRLGLTIPGPLLVQSLDKGLEGVIEPILAEMPDKVVIPVEYDWDTESEDFNQEYAQHIRETILKDYYYGLKHARSILWDKESDIREVFQYAEFVGPTDGNVKDYGKLNQRYVNVINKAKGVPGLNFGLLQAMKYKWVTGERTDPRSGAKKATFLKTDKRIRKGYEGLDTLVFTEINCVRSGGEFTFEIGKCR